MGFKRKGKRSANVERMGVRRKEERECQEQSERRGRKEGGKRKCVNKTSTSTTKAVHGTNMVEGKSWKDKKRKGPRVKREIESLL